jgi:hypothetical protein
VADYSEFPTTPTAWQEQQLRDWQTVTPLETSDPEPRRRRADLGALVPGLFFVVLAITLMAGAELPIEMWEDGGFVWILLIGGGIALLVSELKKARRRRAFFSSETSSAIPPPMSSSHTKPPSSQTSIGSSRPAMRVIARTMKRTPGTRAVRSTLRGRAGSTSSVVNGAMVCQSFSCCSCHAVGVVGNSL